MKRIFFVFSMIFLISISTESYAYYEDMDVESKFSVNTNEIQHVIADEKNDRIYIIASKHYFEEELIALDLSGNEIWRYSPKRYVDFELFIQDDGNLILKTLYASKLLTNGYDIGGTKIISFNTNGKIQWEVEDTKALSKLSISSNGNIIGYNSSQIFRVDSEALEISEIYKATNINASKYESISEVKSLGDKIRVLSRSNEGTFSMDITNSGDVIDKNFLAIDNVYSYMITDTGEVIQNNGGIASAGKSFRETVYSKSGFLNYFKGNYEDNFIYYDNEKGNFNKIIIDKYDYTDKKQYELNNGALLDDKGNIYYTQKNRLIILSNEGKKLKQLENKSSSNLFLGDILNSHVIILYSDTNVYFVDTKISEILRNWSEWPEKVTNDSKKKWTIKFSKPLNPKTVNSKNIFVSMFENGKYEEKVDISLSLDGKSIIVAPSYGYWFLDYGYLFISDEVESENGQALGKNTRMKFTITK